MKQITKADIRIMESNTNKGTVLEPVVSVALLREVLKDLIDNNGFVANHEDDKDCGNKAYATTYDVIEIKDIREAFVGVIEDE